MKALLWTGILLSAALPATAVFADDKAACLDAVAQGQASRDAHKLLEAREQFRVCARKECPAIVQADCAVWLDAVEKSLPTVVLTAKNRAGADVVDVRVRADGLALATALDGRSVPMNPGLHTFRFDGADGSSVEQQLLLTEGERNRVVAVVLSLPAIVSAPSEVVPVPRAVLAPAAPPARERPSGLRTVGWVVGGLGVVGLGVGTAFGLLAIGNKGSAHCDATGDCTAAGPLASARSAAAVSDAGLIAGGVLFAGGVGLVLLSVRSGGQSPAIPAALRVGPAGRGLAVGGSF